MNIIDLGLEFGPMTKGNTPGYIGLHHSGGVGTVRGYHAYHKSKGWAGLGYNFVVDLDGTVYKGRDVEYVPAGILGHNQNSLHICAIGNFENMIMPVAQREAIKELIVYCKSLYPTIKEVKGHRELMSTDCPGRNYPIQVMKDTFINGIVQVHVPQAPSPNKIFKLQHALNAMFVTDESCRRLVEDGIFGDHTKAAIKKLTIKMGAKNVMVGWIQEQLAIHADNIFGSITRDTVMRYQKAHGLAVDGIVGFNTLNKLAS